MSYIEVALAGTIITLAVLVVLIGRNIYLLRVVKSQDRAIKFQSEELISAANRTRKMDERSQAAYRSKYVASAAEKMAPFLPGFPVIPRVCKFLGDPIDYVAFEGLEDESETPRPITIYFVEVKTGSSTLSRDQERIKSAIHAKRIVWIEYRPSLDESTTEEIKSVMRVKER